MEPDTQTSLSAAGFAILPGVFAPAEVEALIDAAANIPDGLGVRSRTGVYAVRNLLQLCGPVRELAHSEKLRRIAGDGRPVRATLFDKTPGANWLVPWHQDLTICLAGRLDVLGFSNWSRKTGVWHVQPPAFVLENILSLRIHLDDCHEDNGALRVLPGTHASGRLSAAQIAEKAQSIAPVVCAVKAGGTLLMRPLLIHASSAASRASHRRVIHIDYAFTELPGGLRFLEQ